MSWVDAVARRIGRLSAAGRRAVRALTPLDTNPVPGSWVHVTKVDPEGAKRLPLAYPAYLRHTDAVSVGGSADVTPTNTCETFELLDVVPDLPTFHEPSDADHVTREARERADFLAIPEVLNGNARALIGTLGVGTAHVRDALVPDLLAASLPRWILDRWEDRLADFATGCLFDAAIFEAYIIQNPDSAAAREAGVGPEDCLSPAAARQRALAAEVHLESEIVYVEYSGTYGGDEAIGLLHEVANALSWSRLWYGGGLGSREDVTAILDAGADTVVVGDVFHDVATEEAELYDRARRALSNPDETAIREWLESHVTLDETAASRYLSTIPSIRDPVDQARSHLVSGLALRFAVAEAVAAVETDGSNPREQLSDALDARRLATRHLPGAVDAGEVILESVAMHQAGVEVPLPVAHLAGVPENHDV